HAGALRHHRRASPARRLRASTPGRGRPPCHVVPEPAVNRPPRFGITTELPGSHEPGLGNGEGEPRSGATPEAAARAACPLVPGGGRILPAVKVRLRPGPRRGTSR